MARASGVAYGASEIGVESVCNLRLRFASNASLFCVTSWVRWPVCIGANTVQCATFSWAVAETVLV